MRTQHHYDIKIDGHSRGDFVSLVCKVEGTINGPKERGMSTKYE